MIGRSHVSSPLKNLSRPLSLELRRQFKHFELLYYVLGAMVPTPLRAEQALNDYCWRLSIRTHAV
jgi:hypothetical protein